LHHVTRCSSAPDVCICQLLMSAIMYICHKLPIYIHMYICHNLMSQSVYMYISGADELHHVIHINESCKDVCIKHICPRCILMYENATWLKTTFSQHTATHCNTLQHTFHHGHSQTWMSASKMPNMNVCIKHDYACAHEHMRLCGALPAYVHVMYFICALVCVCVCFCVGGWMWVRERDREFECVCVYVHI